MTPHEQLLKSMDESFKAIMRAMERIEEQGNANREAVDKILEHYDD